MMRRIAVAVLALCLAVTPAAAETVRIVVPFAPGGALDPLARILANGLAKLRPHDVFLVENIGGAGGMLGLGTVAKAAPDGRTLLFTPSGPMVLSPLFQTNLPFDHTTAFDPIVLVGSVKSALIVRAGLNIHTLAELIAAAKGGAKFTYGSTGIGTSPHISGAMLAHAAGIQMTHVPYRGLGPAMNDIVGGHIDAIATSVTGVLPYVRSNRARALATLDNERSPELPDVPTTVELGYRDVVMPQWYGVLGPAGLPAEMRDTLEAQALSVLRSPEVVKQLAVTGIHDATGRAEFQAMLAIEFKKWPAVLPKLGIAAQ